MQDGIEAEECTDTSSTEDEEVHVRTIHRNPTDTTHPTPTTPIADKSEAVAAGKKLRTTQPSPPVSPQVTPQGAPSYSSSLTRG